MKLSSLKGIGQKTEQLFTKAGITDTSQLPYYYPRGYDIYKEPVLISEIDEDGIYTLYLSIAYKERDDLPLHILNFPKLLFN